MRLSLSFGGVWWRGDETGALLGASEGSCAASMCVFSVLSRRTRAWRSAFSGRRRREICLGSRSGLPSSRLSALMGSAATTLASRCDSSLG